MNADSNLDSIDVANVAVLSGVALVTQAGKLSAADGLTTLASAPFLICHASFLIDRLAFAASASKTAIRAAREQKHLDVAELFAFVCPARMATPTPTGFARSLALDALDGEIDTLQLVAHELLARLGNRHYPAPREAAEIATYLARANWPWAKPVMAALLKANPNLDVGTFATGLNVWDRIEDWEDDGVRPPGRHEGITPEETTRFLEEILGKSAERRPQQKHYAATATFAFEPRQKKK
jgi:ATP-dependent DNA helicase DinG